MSKTKVQLSLLVPKSFQKKLKKQAVDLDISMTDLIIYSVETIIAEYINRGKVSKEEIYKKLIEKGIKNENKQHNSRRI